MLHITHAAVATVSHVQLFLIVWFSNVDNLIWKVFPLKASQRTICNMCSLAKFYKKMIHDKLIMKLFWKNYSIKSSSWLIEPKSTKIGLIASIWAEFGPDLVWFGLIWPKLTTLKIIVLELLARKVMVFCHPLSYSP